MIGKLKFLIQCASLVLAILMITGCIPNEIEENIDEALTPEKVEVVVAKPEVNSLVSLEESYKFLKNEHHYVISSEYGDFGENVTFLPDKVSGDLIVAKGSYSSGLLFYRIYNITSEKIQIVYEVTNERSV